ncbi:MAG TPA: C4-dicarboxylate ABC transporter permease [Synergistaceae bacterium]|nr:C4-dicarboxylate ABC transporter permease [Synergistaceae bacterium]
MPGISVGATGGSAVSEQQQKVHDIIAEETKTINVDEILKKYDRESTFRELTGMWARIIAIICICFSLFQLYTAAFGVYPAQIQRGTHLAFALALVFLLYPATAKGSRSSMNPVDVVLAALGAIAGAYLVANYHSIVLRGGLPTTMDLIVAGVTVLLVLEGARRVIGSPISIIAIVFILYAYLGPYIPGMFGHRGFTTRRILNHLYMTTEGIFGLPLGVSATFVYLFILFGAFLHKSGLGKFFIDLALAATGHTVGGPAKVAVLASGLFGTISGSSVANVVTTGTFTIPLMKSIGYPAHFAGAVEAAASTGGQLMPPIMGAAAFVMSEFIGVPYATIAIAAALPAVLYYLAVGLMVHMEALRLGLKGLPKESLPDPKKVLREGGHLLIPLGVIIYMLVSGYTPLRAALVCIVATVVVAMMRKNTRLKLSDVLQALEDGARSALGVAAACAAAGIIIGIVTLTGLGLKMANGIIMLAGGSFFFTLFLTMIASIILGMGLPTTAKYIILASMAAPAIQKFGVPAMAAHMFILYYGIIADLTPPVALAAYAGAGIAGANPMKTGWTSLRLAIAAFLIPYIFAYNPSLLLIDTTAMEVVLVSISALMGAFCLAVAGAGFWYVPLSKIERVVVFAGALMLIKPGLYTDLAGAAILVLDWFYQKSKRRKSLGGA